MNRKTKLIIIILISVLLLGIIFFSPIKKLLQKSENKNIAPERSAQSPQKNSLPVNAIILKQGNLKNIFKTIGVLLPDEEVDLTFETSGKITNIFFKEGSYVSKGDLLAKINDKPLQAELKKLETQLPLANERVFRQKTLLEKDAVSKETYEVVVTDLEKLKADIELKRSQISQTELRAPFSGIIGLRQVSEGAYASPQVIISRLTKNSPLKVQFSVNQHQINNVKAGTKINFRTNDDLIEHQATVYAVESQLDTKTLSLFARAKYNNADGKVKPGQSATIEIELDEISNSIIIPSVSAIAELGKDIAYIYNNGKAKKVVLEKGLRTENSVQIIKGLSAGDTLLTTGVMQLRDNLPVKINELTNQTFE